MQFQILIITGRFNPIICIICVFSPTLCLEALSSCFLMTSFTLLSVTPLVYNAASKLNYWGSLQKLYFFLSINYQSSNLRLNVHA